jgi:hypothetical protein
MAGANPGPLQLDRVAGIGSYGIWYARNEIVKSRKRWKQGQLDILACGMPKITEFWFLFIRYTKGEPINQPGHQ